MEIFKKGLELNSEDALLLWNCALVAQKLGRNADAVMFLRKALTLNLDPSLKRFAQTLLRSLGGGTP
jgi:tetratricopeptide (TPR) repeat protein